MAETQERPSRAIMRDLLRKTAAPSGKPAFGKDPVWEGLRKLGTRLWLDTGDLEGARSLWTAEMEALTTNNTLLNREIQKGIYDSEIPEVAAALRKAAPGMEEKDLVREVSLYLNARHGLKLVEAFGAQVSVEVHTDLANDVEETVETARFLHGIDPEHFYVKIPLTPAGILATRRLAAMGVPVNHTLGFSARQNLVVAALAGPACVNVFMGRLNSWVAANGLGDGRLVGEKATQASQREILGLREKGRPTLQIGASMREGEQVALLAGLDVFTMPLKVAGEFHDAPPASLESCLEKEFHPAFASGVDPAALGIPALWKVEDSFQKTVLDLAARVEDSWTPERLEEAFREIGAGDLFPAWTPEEEAGLAEGGKLPALERWKEDLEKGRKGLDALFTKAGLLAFAGDQAALDDRVRGLLG